MVDVVWLVAQVGSLGQRQTHRARHLCRQQQCALRQTLDNSTTGAATCTMSVTTARRGEFGANTP